MRLVDHLGDAHPVDLVELELTSGATVRIRPSGTEPLLKVYLEVVASERTEGRRSGARRRLGALEAGIDALTSRPAR